MHLLGKCSELIRFWATLAQLWPLGGHNMTENSCFRPLCKSIHEIQFKLGVYTHWVSVQNWFVYGPRWSNFGALEATKWLKMVISGNYLETFSHKQIQTWCVHSLDECWELIRFWAMLGKFCPLVATKWLKIMISDHYLKKVFMQSKSNLVCTLIGWVFRSVSLLGHVGQILALKWPKN